MDMNALELPSLPPLAAVRAFEAAARHGSFTAAASELGMTQAAVSYQIKILEDRVGQPLFRRRARGVTLTHEGARLADKAGEAMEILRQAFAEARNASDETLVISVLISFAAQILAPRLGRFQIEHPEVTTRVDVDHRLADLHAGEATVALRAGGGKWPGLAAHYLMPIDLTPIVSPAFVARFGLPQTPADLLSLPLIDPNDEGWAGWFEASGVTPPKPRKGGYSLFGTQLLTVQAAIAGEGACLLNPLFFRDMISRGELIQPFDILWRDSIAMYLCYPERRRNVPSIRAFRDWILGEMRDMGVGPA